MRELVCPDCGGKYGQIKLHWNRSSCNTPQFTGQQIEIMKGLLLGDADIKPGTNGSIFRIRMTNKRFLDHLDTILHPLSRGVTLHETGSEKFDKSVGVLEGTSKDSEFQDLYGIRTITHEQINELFAWYDDGEKQCPETITDTMFKYWYICDGWNHDSSSIRIRCVQWSEKLDRIADNIEENSYLEVSSVSTSKGVIRMTAKSSREFWRTEDVVNGFDYKWE